MMTTSLDNDTVRPLETQNALSLDASGGPEEAPRATGLDDARKMPVHPENEAALLACAKAGDREAFARLLGGCDQYIYRVAFKIMGNREDAEDVRQETILKAYTHLGEFRGESRFHTWLVRITVNEALMKIRKRSWEQLESLDRPIESDDEGFLPREIRDDAAQNPEEHYANAELQSILAEAIGKLAPPLRTVFLLREVENFSTEETARMMGVQVPAVKSRLLRARLKLRQLLARRFKLSPAGLRDNRSHLRGRSGSFHPARLTEAASWGS